MLKILPIAFLGRHFATSAVIIKLGDFVFVCLRIIFLNSVGVVYFTGGPLGV